MHIERGVVREPRQSAPSRKPLTCYPPPPPPGRPSLGPKSIGHTWRRRKIFFRSYENSGGGRPSLGDPIVKGLSRACQGVVKGLSRALSRACQGVVKGLSRALSRACQGLVKGLSRGPPPGDRRTLRGGGDCKGGGGGYVFFFVNPRSIGLGTLSVPTRPPGEGAEPHVWPQDDTAKAQTRAPKPPAKSFLKAWSGKG